MTSEGEIASMSGGLYIISSYLLVTTYHKVYLRAGRKIRRMENK